MPSTTAPAPAVAPSELLLRIATGGWAMRALWVAAELGVADLLRAGPVDVGELASRLKVHPDSLYRVLRFLASAGIFTEQPGRKFALNAAGELLRSDVEGTMRPLSIMMGRAWETTAWANILHAVRTGKPAFDDAHKCDIWTYFKNHADDAANFNACMTSFAANMHAAVLDAYDFTGISTLADIGGGHGRFLGLVLRKYPGMRGVLFDQPHVVSGATEQLRSMGGDVAGRCRIVGGSFFESVPASCDAYSMGHILHDWDDEHCTKILRTIRRAAGTEGAGRTRLLVIEAVLAGPNEPDAGKLLDLEMLVTPGGRERTEAEFSSLLSTGGWKLTRVVPTSAGKAVVEGVAV